MKPDVIPVRCPGCNAELVVDAATGAVIEHHPPPAPARTVDLDRTQELLQRQQQERDRRFQASVQAEKQRDDLLTKKFDQGLRRARENPNAPRPIRDMDLD